MDNPFKTTVQLTKEEKLKLINSKLNNMLKQRKIDPFKIAQEPSNQPQAQNKIQNNQQKNKNAVKSQLNGLKEGEDKVQEDSKNPQKSKLIKKTQKKQPKVLRKAAGEVWKDKTMQDWPDNDYRIFCGNLGNEVNDQILGSVFRRYSSFQMARVVRDRRTGKTRGYGFVSFTRPEDFLNALKEMNGKHVGNRPVKLMKSSWKDRDLNSEKNQALPSDFKKNAQKQTHKINIDFNYVSSL